MKTASKTHKEKHEFALHISSLSSLVAQCAPGDSLMLTDEAVVHRIRSVLRLKEKDRCVFFDRHIRVFSEICDFIGKKQIRCTLLSKEANTILSPSLTFLLPVLKREDFESALYSLTEVGVTTIQLVVTHKTHGTASSFTQKDLERAQRIIIAAAEQSKNFAYPDLKFPIPLSQIIHKQLSMTRLFFDQKGNSLFPIAESLQRERPHDIVLLIGPEGDLNSEEKEMVLSNNFVACSLTPTVLRSVQAAALGAGLIRALLIS